MPIGLELPLQRSIKGGFLSTTDKTIDAIKSNLINVLSVQRGERKHDLNFGTNIRSMLFLPYNDALKNRVKDDITSAIERYASYVNLNKIDIVEFESGKHILVRIEFSTNINLLQNSESLEIEINAAQ